MAIKQSKKKVNFKIIIAIIATLAIVAIASINTETAHAEVTTNPSSLGGSASVSFNTVGLGSEFNGQLISQFTINWHTGGEGSITVPGGTIDDVNEKSMFEGTLLSPLASSLPNTQYVIRSMTGSAQETNPVIWPRLWRTDLWALYVKSSTENVIVTITYIPQYKVTFDASTNVKADSAATILTVNGTALTASDLPYTTDWVSQGDKLAWVYSDHVASTSDPTNLVYSIDSTSGLGQTGRSGILTVNSPGTITGTYIKQVHNTFQATGLSGTDYVILTGTNSSVSGSQLGILSASNNWQADVYCDYNTPITFAGSSHNSGTTERWAFQNALPYTSSALTTSGGTYSQTYYHQYAIILDYTVIGGGGTNPALDAPILSGTSAGEVGYINNILPRHSGAVVPLWLDAGTTWQLSSQLRRSTTTERWNTNQITTGTANAPVTATYTYYHQVKNTVTAEDIAGTCSIDITGTLFGTSATKLVTLNSSNSWTSQVWSDYNTIITFPAASTPVNGERWQFFSTPNTFSFVSDGNSFLASDAVHQYLVTFNYNIAARGSLDKDPIAYYTKFGVACNATALTYSGPADWVDAGTSVSYQNNIFSIGYLPLWQINLPVTDGKSVIPNPINQAVTVNPTYYKRAELKIDIDGITGSAALDLYGTAFGVPNMLIMTLNETNGWSASAWVDDGTDVTLPAAAYVNENERWMSSLNMGQDYTFTVNVGFGLYDSGYIHQYRNLYIATGLSGNDAIYIMGTYLGESRSITTLYASTSWTAFGWSDIGTTATFPASSTLSTAQERWTIGSPYTTEAITSGAGFYGEAYTHQYNVTFQYSTSDGKAIPDGTTIGTYTQFGQEKTLATSPQYQTTLPAFDWVDAQTQVYLQNYTNPQGTNRWILTDSQITVSSSTLNLGLYYHQVSNTLTATGLSGTDSVKVQGTYCGNSSVIATLTSLTSWSSQVWSDSGAIITFQGLSYNSDADERWILNDNSAYTEDGGFSIVKAYIHQCKIVFSVSGDGLASNSGVVLTVNGEKLSGTQLPYQTTWVTTGSTLTFTYENLVANSNDGRYFWSRTSGLGQSGQSGTLTVTSPGTVTATYGTQYMITAEAIGNGTINPTNGYYTKGASQTFTITPQAGYHIANITIDGRAVDPSSSLQLKGIQAGHKIIVNFAEDQDQIPDEQPTPSPSPSPNPSPSPSASESAKNSESVKTNSTVMLSVAASVVLLISLLVFGLKRSKI